MSDAWFAFGVVLSLVVHTSLVRGVEGIEPLAVQEHTTDTLWRRGRLFGFRRRRCSALSYATYRLSNGLGLRFRLGLRLRFRFRFRWGWQRHPLEPVAPVDLTGVTLSAGSGGWAPSGNGEAGGPIRTPRQGRVRAEQPDEAAGPAMVAVGDLSRPPDPPNLDTRLLEQYPENARRQGIPGNALVRARILPTGRIDRLRVVSASSPRFAQACRAVLRGSRWSAPLDRRGNPVATEIRYRCQFQVR